MKLYSVKLSPFATRVRMAIRAKGLDIKIVPPPGVGARSVEYLAINPIGKVPSLVLQDGTVIPESDTIVEYLEDAFPAKSLRPASAEGKARARLLARVAELYVMNHGAALFGQMNPVARDQAVVDQAFVSIDQGLVHLNHYLGDGPYAVDGELTTADCALAPLLFFVGVFSQTFARPDVLTKFGKLGAYWEAVQKHPAIAHGLGEMREALQERIRAGA